MISLSHTSILPGRGAGIRGSIHQFNHSLKLRLIRGYYAFADPIGYETVEGWAVSRDRQAPATAAASLVMNPPHPLPSPSLPRFALQVNLWNNPEASTAAPISISASSAVVIPTPAS
jgi:hypothetical protein